MNPYASNNLVYQQGNTTYILVPTQNLPILGVFATIFPVLNTALKADIETAYSRPETQTAAQQGITIPSVNGGPPLATSILTSSAASPNSTSSAGTIRPTSNLSPTSGGSKTAAALSEPSPPTTSKPKLSALPSWNFSPTQKPATPTHKGKK